VSMSNYNKLIPEETTETYEDDDACDFEDEPPPDDTPQDFLDTRLNNDRLQRSLLGVIKSFIDGLVKAIDDDRCEELMYKITKTSHCITIANVNEGIMDHLEFQKWTEYIHSHGPVTSQINRPKSVIDQCKIMAEIVYEKKNPAMAIMTLGYYGYEAMSININLALEGIPLYKYFNKNHFVRLYHNLKTTTDAETQDIIRSVVELNKEKFDLISTYENKNIETHTIIDKKDIPYHYLPIYYYINTYHYYDFKSEDRQYIYHVVGNIGGLHVTRKQNSWF
jgi:hypothetical protein